MISPVAREPLQTAGPRRTCSPSLWLALSSLLVLAAFGLRAARLGDQSLWPDDLASLVNARLGLVGMWSEIQTDHVPLYPLVLGNWTALAGAGEFSLRYLSVLFSTVSVPLVIVLGRRLISPTVGYVAGALTTVAVFQLYYAQEVRQYAMLGALGLLASWVFLREPAKPTPGRIALLAFLYAALVYTHYMGVLVPATHVLVLLLRLLQGTVPMGGGRPEQAPATFSASWWLLAWIGAALLLLPWIASHLGEISGNVAGGTSQPFSQILRALLVEHAFGHHVLDHLDDAHPADAVILRNLTWAALLLPLGFLLALLVPRARGSATRPSGYWIVILHAVVPYGLLLLVLVSREYATRYGYVATVWFPLALAAGYCRLPGLLRWCALAVLLAFQLWGMVLYFEHPGLTRLDFRAAVQEIATQQRPADAVIVTAPYVMPTFERYADELRVELPRAPLPAAIPLDEAETRATLTAMAAQSERLWHLRWQDYFADPDGFIGRWLDANAIRLSETWIGTSLGGDLNVDLWLTRLPTLSELPADASPARAQLGDTVHLVGHRWRRDRPNRLTLDLFWQLDAPLAADYTVFLHLLDRAQRRLAQADARPYQGRFPTQRWPVGTIIQDHHEVSVGCLSPGEYQLAIGLYELQTMRRFGRPGSDTVVFSLLLPVPQDVEAGGPFLRLLPAAMRLDHRLPGRPASGC